MKPAGFLTVGTMSIAPTTKPTQADVGAEYTAIRNAVQSVRVPPELTLPDSSRQGVNRTDQIVCNIIIRN